MYCMDPNCDSCNNCIDCDELRAECICVKPETLKGVSKDEISVAIQQAIENTEMIEKIKIAIDAHFKESHNCKDVYDFANHDSNLISQICTIIGVE